MIDTEEALLHERTTNLNNFYTNTESRTLLSLFFAAIALLYAILTFNNQYRQKKKANRTTAAYRLQLENNVQELRSKNEELKELEGVEKLATIGRVARVMAHEVRNPLTNISLATEQLSDISSLNENEEARLLVSIINRNATRIGQMVSDLLNATKLIQLDMQKVDINRLLDESLENARDRLALQKIRIIKNYSTEICGVMVDNEKIKIGFLNLIVNAIEAMEELEGERILELTTYREGDKCVVEIKDNGKGMDEHTLNNIFEPYFTVKKKGNGLGLTNTQNIILNHKGNIKVQSQPGNGTRFTVYLNVA